ncbi:MAG: MBL fold metallo-hydrolase [Actinomycetota bacterium]|nr:MBL fold metallo-hydrolase [Actinomycetota bacterium]
MEHRRREPAPGVFRLVLPLPFPGLDRVNAYLLAGNGGVVLVDCGMWDPALDDGGYSELEAAVAATEHTLDDVRTLILTHPHIDHYGMAGRVVEATGCELWMHEAARAELAVYRDPEALAAELKSMLTDHGVGRDEIGELSAFEDWRPFVYELIDATRWLTDGDDFEAGGRTWRVLHTPGHDSAHVCLWDEAERILISGDTLLGSITPHIDFRRGDGNPLGDYLASLARIEELAPALVLPGHGRPFEDGADRARVTARHHDRRLGAIVQVVRREPHTASEITDAIFGDTLLNFERRLAFGEALAHLAYLRANGEVERIEAEDGTFLYRKRARRPTQATE